MKIKSLIALMLGTISVVCGQEPTTWSLEQCIKHAQKHSLAVQQSMLTAQSSALDIQSAKGAKLPSLNANANYGLNLGRSVDPTSNSFAQQTIQSVSLGASGSVPIWSAGRLKYNEAAAKLNNQASEIDVVRTQRDVALQVANFYLNALLAQESIKMGEEQLKQNLMQEERFKKMVNLGTAASSALVEYKLQIARAEQNLTASKGNLKIALMNLQTYLQLDPNTSFNIETPSTLGVEPVLAERPDFVFNEALKNYPDIQVAQLRKMSAEQSVKAAEAAKYPTLSGFYQIRTNYSSLGVRVAGTELVTRNFGNVTLPNVGSVPLLVESTSPIYGKDPIFSQLETNISSGVGLTLSVPILNNLQIKTAIQRSQLNIIQIDNNIKVLAQQLKNTIYQTHTQAQVLKERFVAVQKTIGAQKENIEIIRKKQTLGSANMFELLNAEQNLPILQSEYLQLKYNLLYQIKILDFYAGKGLQF